MDPQSQSTPPTPQTLPQRPVAVPPRAAPAIDRAAPQRPINNIVPPANTPSTQQAPVVPVSTPQPFAQPPQQATPALPPVSPSSSPTPPSVRTSAPLVEQPSDALMQKAAHNDHKRLVAKKLKSFTSFAVFVATVIVAAVLINSFVFQSYYVDGTSMTPTLQNEDRLIIEKANKTLATIQGKVYLPSRGEIVVLDSAIIDQYGHEEQLIKRIIGLPGDTITIKDGKVTIKNKENPQGFDVDQKLGLTLEMTYSDTPIEVTVPDNHVYVLGDNRGINGSLDSRSFGMVESSKIQGHLAIRIFPFNRTQFFN